MRSIASSTPSRRRSSARGPRSRKRSYRYWRRGWLDHFIFNEYYPTEEEFLFALTDAVHEEYRAVVAAGFVLQARPGPGLADGRFGRRLDRDPRTARQSAGEPMQRGQEVS